MLKEQLIFLVKNLGRYEQINGLLNKSIQYYRIGDDCKTSLDNILTLVKELNNIDVLIYLWDLQLLEKHLLTIFLLNNNIKDNETKSIILIITELFVLMTTPIDLNQIVDFADDNACLQRDILKAQYAYKDLFTKNPAALRTLLNLLNDHLIIEVSKPTESNVMTVCLVLSLFRNLLAIDKKDKILHYNLVLQYYKETIIECFCSFHQKYIELFHCNIIIQEIFYHIFHDIEPSDILVNPTVDANEFSKKLLEDEEKKKEDRRRFNERFSGKYWIKMPDGYEILTSKKDARADKLPNEQEEKENKRTIREEWLPKKKSILDISDTARECLKVTAIKFLNTIFTTLVHSVGKDLKSEHYNDYQHSNQFFYIVRFFLELYQLLSIKDSNIVSIKHWPDILNYKIFKLMFNKIRYFKDQKLWSELQVGLECLKQMSKTIETMGSKHSNKDHEIRNKAQQLQYRILCDQENLELVVDVVKRSSKQSLSFLRSLVETVHRLLSMLERVKSRKYIYVKQKRQTNRSNKKVKYIKDEYEYRIDKIDSREQRFRTEAFDRYEMCYVDEEVLSTYCALLDKEYEIVDFDFHYINTMFFRIFSNCESSIFMKLSFMELLHRVLEHFNQLTDSFQLNLNDSQIKFKEFAYKIVKDFAIQMEKNPLTYIELILPKIDLLTQQSEHESYYQALLLQSEHEFYYQALLPERIKAVSIIHSSSTIVLSPVVDILTFKKYYNKKCKFYIQASFKDAFNTDLILVLGNIKIEVLLIV
ncbi:3315_t:CDS:10 [Cetraspora pellucida]|uniref:3315_t:CDS:1 n=1 Tax=Cetraspora pellucida TaxID=1433469 RepID=A0A9N8ZYF9_9GLOM|nr:3315_t:CDS:10 [Cetraspora pellucida]